MKTVRMWIRHSIICCMDYLYSARLIYGCISWLMNGRAHWIDADELRTHTHTHCFPWKWFNIALLRICVGITYVKLNMPEPTKWNVKTDTRRLFLTLTFSQHFTQSPLTFSHFVSLFFFYSCKMDSFSVAHWQTRDNT